jgi:hypothetical protein
MYSPVELSLGLTDIAVVEFSMRKYELQSDVGAD